MDNTIRIVRGTTNTFGIDLKDETGAFHSLQEGEVLRFGVKVGAHRQDYELIKELTAADINETGDAYILKINPADTEKMDFGEYCYDVGLQAGNNYYMVIPCSEFIVAHNITCRRENGET